jgi:hypothetical protein
MEAPSPSSIGIQSGRAVCMQQQLRGNASTTKPTPMRMIDLLNRFVAVIAEKLRGRIVG